VYYHNGGDNRVNQVKPFSVILRGVDDRYLRRPLDLDLHTER
jgi:hypothetical protein